MNRPSAINILVLVLVLVLVLAINIQVGFFVVVVVVVVVGMTTPETQNNVNVFDGRQTFPTHKLQYIGKRHFILSRVPFLFTSHTILGDKIRSTVNSVAMTVQYRFVKNTSGHVGCMLSHPQAFPYYYLTVRNTFSFPPLCCD